MERLLTALIQEFRDNLPDTEDSTWREVVIPDIPKMINVATGIRRSGKTYLIYQKIRELVKEGISLDQILFINFEDDRLLPMSQKELSWLLETFYTLYPENHKLQCYLFLDEIQNVEGWPLVVRRFHDSKKVRLFLSGSSAKLLSKEIATSLRGRSIATEVWTYSFSEYLRAQAVKLPEKPFGKRTLDEYYKHFKNYLFIGGFPAVQKLHENERRTVLQSYVDTVIFRDIIERYKITKTSLVKYLIKTLIKNAAAPFSAHKLYKDITSQGFKVGKDTIYQYLEYIEDAFLAFTVPIFSESLRKMEVNPKKIYIIDNGLVYANRIGISNTMGNLFENQVYLDLRREGKQVSYYLTKEGLEIDFVVKSPEGAFELIQVVWDASDPKTLKREQRALEQAEKELGIKGRILTPMDYLEGYLKAYFQ